MHNRRAHEILIQDAGLLIFFISVFCCAYLLYTGGGELLPENAIMLFITVAALMLITFSSDMSALLTVGAQLICYTAYKLFMLYQRGTIINIYSYAWLILPIAVTGSMKLFLRGRNRLELENGMLKQQLEELVMVDPLTGLYNLKSFYYDIDRQIRHSRRYKLPLTLMIIQLRYAEELRRLLSKKDYDGLKQRLAEIVGEAIRAEDRQYSIDGDGSLALILTCDEEGGELIRNRIRSFVSEKDAFDKIAGSSVRVQVRIAFAQYGEDMGNDVVYFKKYVERELQYDV